MKKLIMCTGLPGAGKTTWAIGEVNRAAQKLGLPGVYGSPVVRVNKDDIRRELEKTGWVWSPEQERDVLPIRDKQINDAFAAGAEVVISDDTNFGKKHKSALEAIAKANGATFEIKRFDTPVEECIRRDAQRTGKAHVGEAVIRRMAVQNGILASEVIPGKEPAESIFRPYVPNEHNMNAIICDLDGTLSLFQAKGHRGPYDATRCAEDDVNWVVKGIIELFYRAKSYQIIYLSGRFERFREPTMQFLRAYCCPPGPLFMRTDGDTRKDYIVKAELFDANVRDKYNVRFVLDDRDQVVAMWRKLGLTCLQVAEGDF